jgi:hypothetical protein
MQYDNVNLVLGRHNICYLWDMLPVLIILYPASNFTGKNKYLGRLKSFLKQFVSFLFGQEKGE